MVENNDLRVIGYTTTTSDELYLNYYRVMMTSLRKYNDFKMVVFVLDDGIDKVKQYKFDNVEYVDFHESKTKEWIKKVNLPDCSSNFAFGMDKLVNILIGPECLDYMYYHYDYDVLYRTDTDVIYTSRLFFEHFYNANVAFGGCVEHTWREWAKSTFGYLVPIEDEVLNVGMCCFRGNLQTPFMFDEMVNLFKEWDYKINTYEQDAINYVYQFSKYDLTRDGFYLGVNRKYVYEFDGTTCRAFHFVSKDMKPFSLNQTGWFDWCVPIYRLYQNILDEIGIDYKIPYEYKKTFLEEKFMRVGFCSILTGSDIYCDLAIVCMQSYLATNNMEIDWILLCENDYEISRAHERLDFLQSDRFHLRYELLPKVEGVDYNKYNTFGWTSERGSEIFIRRIKFFDLYKNEYDIIVTVDFDILFIDDISSVIERVFYTDGIALSGQQEAFSHALKYGLEHLCNYENLDVPFDHSAYINFGFCVMKCSELRGNDWENFLKITTGKEDYFNTQEQAYFSAAYPPKKKIVYKNLQLLIYGKLVRVDYRRRGNCKMIHFTPSGLLTKIVDVNQLQLRRDHAVDAVTVLMYDYYYDAVQSYNEHLSPEFLNIIYTNKAILDDYKRMHKREMIMLKLYYGISI